MADNYQKIRLLGSSFSLKIDEDPDYFKSIITTLEKTFSKIEQEMGVRDPLRIAILSCILIQDELLKEKSGLSGRVKNNNAEKVEKTTLEIIKLIDEAL